MFVRSECACEAGGNPDVSLCRQMYMLCNCLAAHLGMFKEAESLQMEQTFTIKQVTTDKSFYSVKFKWTGIQLNFVSTLIKQLILHLYRSICHKSNSG